VLQTVLSYVENPQSVHRLTAKSFGTVRKSLVNDFFQGIEHQFADIIIVASHWFGQGFIMIEADMIIE
jgi:C4-dicarboxylate transporter